MSSTTIAKPGITFSLKNVRASAKQIWAKLHGSREAAVEIGEETNNALSELLRIFWNGFQGIVAAVGFTAIGALMIFYIAGYPGGVTALLAGLLITLLPGVPFESAWISLGLGIYILISIGLVFSKMILRAGETSDDEIILDHLDNLQQHQAKMQDDIDRMIYAPDLLTESMANLSDKLDEVKLHL